MGSRIRAPMARIQGDPLASDAPHHGIGGAETGFGPGGLPGRAGRPAGPLGSEGLLGRRRDHIHHHPGGPLGHFVFLQAEHVEHPLLEGSLHHHMDHRGIDFPFQIHLGNIGGLFGGSDPGNGRFQVAVDGDPQFIVQHFRFVFRGLVGIQDNPQPSVGIDPVHHILDLGRRLGISRSQACHQAEKE